MNVQSAGWLKVQGASENVLSADTVGFPCKLKVIHSVITRSSESVLSHQLLQKRHSVVLWSVFMACVRYSLEQRIFIYDRYVEKELMQIMQKKISPWISRHSMSVWGYNFQISEESSNPRHFNWQNKQTNKLHGLSLRANYTDQATAACRRSDCQLLRIEGGTWSAWHPYGRILGFLDRSRYFCIK
jgi:hypothetical protein